jgi:hypothetical protein
MTKEVLKLALEALEPLVRRAAPWGELDWLNGCKAIAAIKEALAQPEPKCVAVVEVFGKDWRLDFMSLPVGKHKLYAQQYNYTAPTQQKHFGWKLVPIEPTNEMLKAMDECSTEGYDERLLAGHAASVYMAAVDVAPAPPQRTWVGLTETEIRTIRCDMAGTLDVQYVAFARAIEAAHGIKGKA